MREEGIIPPRSNFLIFEPPTIVTYMVIKRRFTRCERLTFFIANA
ncbi:MAG: hypothetical protein ACFFD5_03200 [Candidatus Thorarchaeota archaeon]